MKVSVTQELFVLVKYQQNMLEIPKSELAMGSKISNGMRSRVRDLSLFGERRAQLGSKHNLINARHKYALDTTPAVASKSFRVLT